MCEECRGFGYRGATLQGDVSQGDSTRRLLVWIAHSGLCRGKTCKGSPNFLRQHEETAHQAERCHLHESHLGLLGLRDGLCVGNSVAAMGVLREMVEAKIKPNSVTFGCIIHGLGKEGLVEDAENMFQTMKDLGVMRTAVTYNTMINLYNKSGNQQLAQGIFHEMIEAGLEPTYVTFSSMMYCFKSVGSYKAALGIYEDVKGRPSLCTIFTFTEALDASFKWGNWTRVVDVLSDILDWGRPITAVTCTVILMGLSSKCCKTAEEASILIEFMKKYDTKLMIIVRYLLLESLEGDAQVVALIEKLADVINPRDTRTWTVFTSGLIDALWTLGWHHRSSTVFRWTLARELNECYVWMNNREWKLDVRNISVGSAMVAFYHWLKWLEELALEIDRRELLGMDAEAEELGSTTTTELRPVKESLPKVFRGELVFSFERLFETRPMNVPYIVTVVSGVGKFSNPEKGALVREAILKEVLRLKLPFMHADGAWIARWDDLKMWLRDEGIKLLVSDVASE